ncbi:MAG: rod shape-determining protein MreD [Alphaproteobacteria bacterium]|nr:rod shape-determining protein MreD [Alphaproteobacteria bacterium]
MIYAQRLKCGIQKFLFFCLSCFFVLVDAIPVFGRLNIPLNAYLLLMYIGTLYHPLMTPTWSLFLVGLIQDAIYGYPIGTSSFGLLLLHGILLTLKNTPLNGTIISGWCGVAVFYLVASVVHWMVLSCVFWQDISLHPLLWGILFPVSLYPFAVKLLNKLSPAN